MINSCTVSLGKKVDSVLDEIDSHGDNLRYLHVEHDGFDKQGESLIQIAHRHRHIYRLLVELANRGFMVYMAQNSASRLVRDVALKVIWQPLKDNTYLQHRNDVVYTLDCPPTSARHLIVIFSDAASGANKTSLSRYFGNTLDDMKGRLPSQVALLRIGDVGGVCGTAHFGNHRSANRVKNIQTLILNIIDRLDLSAENVTLTGISAGGAAAMFHGSIGGYSQVVVDPCLPMNSSMRPWYNPCFLNGEYCSSLPNLSREGAGSIEQQLVLLGRSGDFESSPLIENVLTQKNCIKLHAESESGVSNNLNAVLNPLYTALSLRALGIDVSFFGKINW